MYECNASLTLKGQLTTHFRSGSGFPGAGRTLSWEGLPQPDLGHLEMDTLLDASGWTKLSLLSL